MLTMRSFVTELGLGVFGVHHRLQPNKLFFAAHRAVSLLKVQPIDRNTPEGSYSWNTRHKFRVPAETTMLIEESENLQRLKEYGLDLNFVSVMHQRLGFYKKLDLDSDVRPRADYLMNELNLDEERVKEIMSRNPSFFRLSIEEFEQILSGFEEVVSVRKESLYRMLTEMERWFPLFSEDGRMGPISWTGNAEKVDKLLKETFGLEDQEITSVFVRLCNVYRLHPRGLIGLYEALVEKGFTQDEIGEMVTNKPDVLLNRKELAESFEYLMSVVGYSKAQIIRDPYKVKASPTEKPVIDNDGVKLAEHRVAMVRYFEKSMEMTNSDSRASYISPGVLMGFTRSLANKLDIDFEQYRSVENVLLRERMKRS